MDEDGRMQVIGGEVLLMRAISLHGCPKWCFPECGVYPDRFCLFFGGIVSTKFSTLLERILSFLVPPSCFFLPFRNIIGERELITLYPLVAITDQKINELIAILGSKTYRY